MSMPTGKGMYIWQVRKNDCTTWLGMNDWMRQFTLLHELGHAFKGLSESEAYMLHNCWRYFKLKDMGRPAVWYPRGDEHEHRPADWSCNAEDICRKYKNWQGWLGVH